MRIVLASGSPRRRELLGNIGVDFEVMTDDTPENSVSGEKPNETVLRLSAQKANNVAKRIKDDAIVIGADTVVAIGGTVLGKPNSESEASKMLGKLSGRVNTVYTGITVTDTCGGKTVSDYVSTDVRFRKLSRAEIENYVKSGEPMDKAGAYGIQNLGALLIEGVDGDYFNVVGLPLCRLGMILKGEFGISLI